MDRRRRALTLLMLVGALVVPAVQSADAASDAIASVLPAGARPSAPLAPKASSRFEAVRLTWRAPSSTGGKAILAYRVQRKTTGGWKTLTSTASVGDRSYLATGLTNLTTYTFRIAAINADGVGPSSDTVKGTPRPYALAPRSLTVAPSDASAVLDWVVPKANGTTEITGYKIQRLAGGSFTTVKTVGGTKRTATVTGLSNGTSHTLRVLAVNSIGNGTPTDAAKVDLPLTSSVAAGGEHTCAVMPDTTVECWGLDDHGQLGDGTVGPDRGSGARVLGTDGSSPLTGVRRVDMGIGTTCAVLTTGKVACWGNNDFGQLGDAVSDGAGGFLLDVPRAVMVREDTGGGSSVVLTDAVEVAVGERHVCVRLADKTVRCWGGGAGGQLGDGSNTPSAQHAVRVTTSSGDTTTDLTNAVEIDAGAFHTCVRRSGGSVYCWGNGDNGRLGNGSISSESIAVQVNTITSATDLSVGVDHSCAVVSGGLAVCWGYGFLGQIGDGVNSLNNSTPQVVRTAVAGDPLTGIASISAGKNMTCARMQDATARCWGYNNDGQLGDGSTSSSSLPVTVFSAGTNALGDIGMLTSGGDHTCVRVKLGRLRCWGYNAHGQLGNGTTDPTAFPVIVTAAN